ncbi:MAG TPA: tRNA (guanosine(46)-N7)-methyltransferase TrmB [Paludibacteraceae bacterium]|nr:tRNA (guanosine(46)-N7)-methyltransferase TrmB [Paludibacteraceae bacterium]HQB68569.1 tRNA (guanosine(46)-N7)-methyltransferase TrmB [Paludibacteraceae bacterium]
MGKNKLKKFADMETFSHVFQCSYNELTNGTSFPLKGKWHSEFFHNNNPIVLELGCGKGEYTVELAKQFPDKNFIGVDIKGARMWTGAKLSQEFGLTNVAFIRTGINVIHYFFEQNEVNEIWITFPDPQMKKVNKRLTSTFFLNIYKQILHENGIINLKTDSNFLFTYTCALVELNKLPIFVKTDNLYKTHPNDNILAIKTYYEKQWLSRGLTIKYLQFSLPHTSSLQEPDIEIPLDEYRSFNRQKRTELDF